MDEVLKTPRSMPVRISKEDIPIRIPLSPKDTSVEKITIQTPETSGPIFAKKNSSDSEMKKLSCLENIWCRKSCDKLLVSLAKDDFPTIRKAFQYFPLSFCDPKAELKFCLLIARTVRVRMLLVSGFGTLTVIALLISFAWLIFAKILNLPENRDVWFFLGCQVVALVGTLCIGLSTLVRCLERHLEVTLYAIYGFLFTAVSLSFFFVAGDLPESKSVAHALTVKGWSDSVFMVLVAFGVLIFSLMVQSRTRLVFWLMLFTCLVEVSLLFLQAAMLSKTPRYCGRSRIVGNENSILCEQNVDIYAYLVAALQSGFLITLTSLGFLARYHNEIAERVDFFRFLKGQERLEELQLHKTRKRDNGTAAVEDILQYLESSVDMIKESNVNAPSLLEAQNLLQQSLNMISKGDRLFALDRKRERKGNISDLEQQFYSIYGGQVNDVTFTNLADSPSSHRKISSDIPLAPSKQLSNEFYLPTTDTLDDGLLDELRDRVGIDWTLNFIELSEKNKHLFLHVGILLLWKSNLFDAITSTEVVLRFLTKVEGIYLPNPYHNSLHGATVAHSAMAISNMLKLFGTSGHEQIYDTRAVTLALAGLCHDVGHPGRNNSFFINSLDPLAIVYNDLAILENFHACVSLRIISGKNTSILSILSREEFQGFRKRFIELILATDMGEHFESISKFRVRRRSPDFNFTSDVDDFWMVAKMCIKAADLSHSMVDWSQHLLWSSRIGEEMYQQGEHEASLGLPVSPLCTRSSHSEFATSQKGFIEFVVQPLMKELEDLDGGEAIGYECVRTLIYNKFRWEEMELHKREVIIAPEIKNCKTMTVQPHVILHTMALKETDVKLQYKKSDASSVEYRLSQSQHVLKMTTKKSKSLSQINRALSSTSTSKLDTQNLSTSNSAIQDSTELEINSLGDAVKSNNQPVEEPVATDILPVIVPPSNKGYNVILEINTKQTTASQRDSISLSTTTPSSPNLSSLPFFISPDPERVSDMGLTDPERRLPEIETEAVPNPEKVTNTKDKASNSILKEHGKVHIFECRVSDILE